MQLFLSIIKEMERTTHCPAKRQTPPKDWTKSPNNCPQKMWKQNMHNPRQKQQLLQKNMTTLKYPPVNYHNYNNGKSTMFQKGKIHLQKVHLYCQVRLPEGKIHPFFSPRTAWSIEFTLRAFETRWINWITAVVPNNWNKLWAIQRCFFFEIYISLTWMLL